MKSTCNKFIRYTNDIGRSKTIAIYGGNEKDGKYKCVIWDNETGEHCGSAYQTPQDITNFLAHYNVEVDLSDLVLTIS